MTTTTTITSHLIDLPSQRLHYLAAGDPAAPPLVLLHGISTQADIWRVNLPGLGQHVYTLAPDLSGYGRSDKPLRPYTPTYQAQLIRELIAALHLQPVALGGNSMGGAIALWLAEQHPELVRALVLADPFGVGLFWKLNWRAVIANLLLPMARIALNGPNLPDYHKILAFNVHDIERLPPAMRNLETLFTWNLSGRTRILAGSGLGWQLGTPWHRWRFQRRLRNLPHPTLIVWGQKDNLLPVNWGEQLHATLPNSQWHIYPDCGHVPPLELPGDFNRRTIEFLHGQPN